MPTWDFVESASALISMAVAVVLLHQSMRRKPIRDASELAEASLKIEKAPPDVRPIAHSQLLEAVASRYFAPPVNSWLLGFFVWTSVVFLADANSPDPGKGNWLVSWAFVAIYPGLLWILTKTDAYKQRSRTHRLLLAQSRASLKHYVDQHQEIDTRSMDDRKYEAIERKMQAWIRNTKGAKETLLVILLVLFSLSLWGMAADLGWM